MKEKICQCCTMPMVKPEDFGTNKDGSLNDDYCTWCYKDGDFTEHRTLDEYIEYSLQFAEQVGMTKDEMRAYCEKILPTLKRWKKI